MTHILYKLEQWIAHRSDATRWVWVACWYGLIFTLSHIPASSSQSTHEMLGGSDIVNTIFRFCAHLGVFGVLAVLVYVALQKNFTTNKKNLTRALLLTTLFGLSDELHQMFVPGRFFRLRDIITDVVGGLLAIVAITQVYRRRVHAEHRTDTPSSSL